MNIQLVLIINNLKERVIQITIANAEDSTNLDSLICWVINFLHSSYVIWPLLPLGHSTLLKLFSICKSIR